MTVSPQERRDEPPIVAERHALPFFEPPRPIARGEHWRISRVPSAHYVFRPDELLVPAGWRMIAVEVDGARSEVSDVVARTNHQVLVELPTCPAGKAVTIEVEWAGESDSYPGLQFWAGDGDEVSYRGCIVGTAAFTLEQFERHHGHPHHTAVSTGCSRE